MMCFPGNEHSGGIFHPLSAKASVRFPLAIPPGLVYALRRFFDVGQSTGFRTVFTIAPLVPSRPDLCPFRIPLPVTDYVPHNTKDNDRRYAMEQLMLFPDMAVPDARAPETITWNLWHGCTKVSPGCQHCYMYRRDESIGKNPAVVQKTQAFPLPTMKLRSGPFKGKYKVPSGSLIYTCFSSDFFHPDADEWRPDAWRMIRERSDCSFFMITKRPERIMQHLPPDWNDGWDHVTIAVTCENQWAADRRLPLYLSLPIRHHSIMIEPMLSQVNLRPYFSAHRSGSGRCLIENVSVGGESGPDARPCDYTWVMDVRSQCIQNYVAFSYHQTGARLIKDGREYHIPREQQHSQAHRAHLDIQGTFLLDTIPAE